MKRCSKCKEIKSIGEFSIDSKKSDGFCSQCKICMNKYTKEWQKNNPERIIKNNREYRKNNPEKAIKAVREWRINNPEKYKEYYKEYQINNNKKLNKYAKLYRNNNRQRLREKAKDYAKNHVEEIKERKRKNYKKNVEHYKQYKKQYCKDNAEKVYKRNKIWIKSNPEKVRKTLKRYHKKRRNNLFYRLNNSMSTTIRRSLKGNKKGNRWESLVNYNLEDLKQHLEKQFEDGMLLENYGKWHIDHIIPRSLWKFKSYDDREFKQCWALANLQPLWAFDNISKGAKI